MLIVRYFIVVASIGIEDGTDCEFWNDLWCSHVALASHFHKPIALANNKNMVLISAGSSERPNGHRQFLLGGI